MTKEQSVDLTIMDAQEWTETDQKIAQIKGIFEEEWLIDDPAIMGAFDEAVKASVKGNIVDEEIE